MHQFLVPGMTCGGCLGSVTRSIQKLDPQAEVEGDPQTRSIKVASAKTEAQLLAALSNAGYPAQTLPQQET
jgi:copper chaperone